MKTKGAVEAEVSRALTQWERDYLGRGSVEVKTDIVRNMVIVVLRGVLTPAEKQLALQKDGMLSLKRMRSELVETGTEQLYGLVRSIVGVDVVSFHTDISTRTGERVMVFMLTESVEDRWMIKK